MMASQTGDNVIGSSGPRISTKLWSRDLPRKRLLGKGLCGIVYETTWKGERYARKDFVDVRREIFHEEVSVLVGLQEHENIVKTCGWTVDNRSCSLLLEYMEDDLLSFLQKRKESSERSGSGRGSGNLPDASRVIDLHKFLEETRNNSVAANTSDTATWIPPLELAVALDIIFQIAKGMAYLHEQKVAHGDLKTRNILVSHLNAGLMSVKVADFGLVRTKSKSRVFASRWARELDMAQWKAPEFLEMMFQHQSEKMSLESDSDDDEADEDIIVRLWCNYGSLFAADVYSFAETCFQILTGEIAYPNLSWTELVKLKLQSQRLMPKLPAAFLPKLLSDLLESCWSSPSQRPSFAIICSKLEGIIHSQMTDLSSYKVELMRNLELGTTKWNLEPDFAATCEQLGEIEDSLKPKPIVLKRKQGEMNRVILTPRSKQKKLELAELMGYIDGMKASSSTKPDESLISDSRSQDDVINEYTGSSSSESEGIFRMPRVPWTQRNPKEVTDSSPDWADWSVSDSLEPQDPSINFQDEVAVSELSLGAHSVSSVGEIKPNTDPSTIESDTAVTDSPSNRWAKTPDNLLDNVSFEVEKGYPSPESPVDDEYLPSPMKNKDADSGSESKSTRSPIARVPSDDDYPKPIQPVYPGDGDSEFDFAIPDEAKTTYYVHYKRKKAFAGIPSKTHHLAVVSVQFWKSKTRAVVDSCHTWRRSYPSDLDIPSFPGGSD